MQKFILIFLKIKKYNLKTLKFKPIFLLLNV